jgi:hypothetical protein
MVGLLPSGLPPGLPSGLPSSILFDLPSGLPPSVLTASLSLPLVLLLTPLSRWGLQQGYYREDGTWQFPIAGMLCNFSKPTAEKPSLLKHSEVFFLRLLHPSFISMTPIFDFLKNDSDIFRISQKLLLFLKFFTLFGLRSLGDDIFS